MIDKLLGIDGANSLYEFYLRIGWPTLVVLGVLAVALVYAFLLYRQERNLTQGRKTVLALCRGLLLVTIIVLLLEPVVGVESRIPVPRNMIVLVDTSESMARKDVRKSALDQQEAALALGQSAYISILQIQAFAQAQRHQQKALEALNRGRAGDASSWQDRAAKALDWAKRESAQLVNNPAADATIIEKLAGLLARQNELLALTKTKSDGKDLRDLAANQEVILRDTTELAGRTPIAAPLAPANIPLVSSVARMDVARGALSLKDSTLTELARQYNLRFFRFDEVLSPAAGVGETVGDSVVKAAPTGKSTRLGSAIEEAVNRYSGQTIAGVIVLTDGACNEGKDPLEVARALKERDIPIYPVGIGLTKPDDVAVATVIVPDVVFDKDNVPVRVQVSSHGYEGKNSDIIVTADGKEVARKTVALPEGARFEELSFKPENLKGSVNLEVSITEQPGELSKENNKVARPIRVIDEKIKVLYIEGKPRWEFLYLRAVLKRDQRLSVKFLLTEGDPDLAKADPDEYLQRFPDDAEAFKYDLVIIGDVPASYFGPGQLGKIEQLVREQGGSFLMLSGHKHAPTSYLDTPIAQVLPVKLKADGWEKVDKLVCPVITVAGRQSMAVNLEQDESRNNATWSLVRPMYELPKLDGPKGGAIVLAELSEKSAGLEHYPLIAWQRYGSGKSLFVGTDQIWRLRYKTGDKYTAHFWGQAIQFLTLSRLLGENKRVRLEMDQQAYSTSQRARIYANVLDEAYMPVKAENFPVYLQREGSEPTKIILEQVPGTPGLFQGFWPLEQEGKYSLKAGAEQTDISNRVEFQVASLPKEQLEPAMQEELLRKVADLSGGRYYTMRDMPGLPAIVESQTKTTVSRKERELWDVWPVFAAMLVLAGIEWFVRRRSDLA